MELKEKGRLLVWNKLCNDIFKTFSLIKSHDCDFKIQNKNICICTKCFQYRINVEYIIINFAKFYSSGQGGPKISNNNFFQKYIKKFEFIHPVLQKKIKKLRDEFVAHSSAISFDVNNLKNSYSDNSHSLNMVCLLNDEELLTIYNSILKLQEKIIDDINKGGNYISINGKNIVFTVEKLNCKVSI